HDGSSVTDARADTAHSTMATAARPRGRTMGHVPEHDAVDPDEWWKTWLRRTGIALLATLAVGTLLAWSWISGLSDPAPRAIPVGVIAGDQNAIGLLNADQQNTELQVSRYANAAALDKALSKNEIDAILTTDQTGLTGGLNLTVAGAAGPGVSAAIVDSVNSVATATAIPLVIEDVYPTALKDPDGRTPFYLMLIWVIGGLAAAVLLGVVLGTVPRDLDRLGMRIGALFAFSLVFGGIGALFAVLTIWKHHLFGTWLVGALVVFTAALITSALQSWLGMWGIGLAVLLLVVIGVPGAGGMWGAQMSNSFFRGMHWWTPTGLSTDLTRGLAYFGRSANAWPITGLALWSLVSIAALVGSTWVLGKRARSLI
ncbi:MAG TPA: hypothetical protein VGJ28_06390, partial [Micromonosporaceae bacterium]